VNRRRFLGQAMACGALAIGAGSFLVVRRSQARAALAAGMLEGALPPLARQSLREMTTLPARAREEIRRYFHGKCLNVHGFVTHVCSHDFGELLGRCRTQEEREACFLQAFCSRVASEAEILNQVEIIAAEVGGEIDSEWSRYCGEVSGLWNGRVQSHGAPFEVDELSNRLSRTIRTYLSEAARQATSADQAPAVGRTIGRIGESAILLLPLVRFGAVGLATGIPVFFVLAARHLWDYVMNQFTDRRADYQAAISGRLALLGNRVGGEFEREVRQRLTDLHTWQERAIRQTAESLAEERVGLL
jgi:hypothetical protein